MNKNDDREQGVPMSENLIAHLSEIAAQEATQKCRPLEEGRKRVLRRSYPIEQLKDPRWIRKRDKILNYADHRCQTCGEDALLQVHHSYYRDGLDAWEYPDGSLIALCKDCHGRVIHGIESKPMEWEFELDNGWKRIISIDGFWEAIPLKMFQDFFFQGFGHSLHEARNYVIDLCFKNHLTICSVGAVRVIEDAQLKGYIKKTVRKDFIGNPKSVLVGIAV